MYVDLKSELCTPHTDIYPEMIFHHVQNLNEMHISADINVKNKHVGVEPGSNTIRV